MTKLQPEIGMFVLPDFGKIQLGSFHRFIKHGLLEELKSFPKIQDADQEFEFQLFGEQYRLGEPLLNEREAVYQSTTYASELYVPAQLTHKREGKVQRQTVSLGNLPLMSSKGTFVINGISRVIVNQILRSPGIYYNSEQDHNGIPIYSATIISDWGGRLKIEIDGRGRIWARISRKRKVLIVILLLAMGLDMKQILAGVSYPKILIESNKKSKEYPKSMEDAMIELYRQLYSVGNDLSFSESIYKELQKRFFQQRCELGTIGRSNFNRRLGLNVSENEKFLLPQDLLAAVDYLIKIKFGMGHLDDIDHLKNRRVRSVADLLIDQLKISLNRLENIVRQALRGAGKRRRLPTPKSLVSSVPLISTFKDFFGSHPLSQFLDQTNPLTEIVHKRRLSSLGPGGLTRRTASFQVRDIHPSHYGRICPIETSEGMNAGLIASLATYARVNNSGFIESPFYKIFEGSSEEDVVYMAVGEDENYRIATGSCLALDQSSQNQQRTAARYQQEFITTSWEKVHFRSIFPLQYFSVGASLIPFLEHDDANRALMGSNMQRQAVPLLQPEKPIVGTGLEAQAALDSGTVVVANEDGKVEYMDGKEIHLLIHSKKQLKIDLTAYQRSNNNTCINQRPTIKIGEYVKQGQILADGSATAGGELALGKNVIVAYMPWEGYNFEDAVLINERLVSEDIYTSVHIEKHEIEIRATNQGPERITREIPHLDDNILRHLDENGIVLPGSRVEVGDVLVGKLTPQETDEPLRAPEGKLLQAIFGLQVATAKETSLKVPPGGEGRVIDVRWIYEEDNSLDHTEIVHVYILQKRRIQAGDKVAGRHGNKGIVSRILAREDMPYLQDGTPVDMVLSPLGVPSRMNVGQIFECLLGLAGNFLNKHYRVMPFDERYEREASRKLVFSELYKASQKTGYSWLFEPESPGKSKLFDGRTGEAFDQHVTVGYAYMLKLIHQVDDKIHARSSGPYALVTQQPLRGRSRRGGQRVGEMEVWALEGFGAAYILQEMLTIKSDHIKARYEVLGAIVTGEPVPKPIGAPESFRLLVRELRSLGVEIGHNIVSQRDLSTSFNQV